MSVLWWTMAVFALDQAAKWLAQRGMTVGQRIPALPGLLEWRLMHNDGMALGLLSGHWLAGVVLPVLAVVIGALALRAYQPTGYKRVAAGLIAGGFAGNMLDRLVNGYVVDMIFFPWMPWYVCNVADVAICAGVGMLVISLLFRPKDWVKKERSHAKDDPDRAA